MKATAFIHLLACHQIDPTDRLSEADPRSKRHMLGAALYLALETRETFFIKGGNLRNALLRPRAAALWLLSLPKRRDLVPPGLRAYLEGSAPALPPSGIQTNHAEKAEENCKTWLAGLPAKPRMIRAAALAAAKNQFQPLSDLAFGRAWAAEAPKKGWNKAGAPGKHHSLIATP